MEAQPQGQTFPVFGIDLLNPSSLPEDGTSYKDMAVGAFWFIVIAFMFFAQHHTCDAYFVPAINVFVTKMRGSPNTWLQRWGEQSVAGATICALGCNGPELFSNLISLYTHSDAGIGVVVGSEIFNLLVITGSSVLAAPIVPLALEKLAFTRDSFAYAISIGMLFWALSDKKITYDESRILLSAAVGYVLMVYFTKDLETYLGMGGEQEDAYAAMTEQGEAPEVNGSEKDMGGGDPKKKFSKKGNSQFRGLQVEVEEIYHGRMVDAHHENSHETEWGGSKGIARLDPISHMEKQMSKPGASASDITEKMGYANLKEIVTNGEYIIDLDFEKAMASGMLLEHVTVRITASTEVDRNNILADMRRSGLGEKIHEYDATIAGGIQHFQHQMHDPGMTLFLKIVFVIPEFFIDGILRLSLFAVDIKDSRKENRWPLCFFGAMCWLAFFSWCMLECANMINLFIPIIPTSFLGITVCAVGTSFPNAVASVILSSQGKPGAAIANALGSNVQNVFLAMALPWVIYQTFTINGAPIPQDVAGIQEGVGWMVGTLILLLVIVIMPPCCKITAVAGWILNAVYGVYAVVITGETFGWWPPLIPQ